MAIVTKEKLEGKRERELITLAITNDQFLKALYPICKPEYLKTPYAKTIWTWCHEYFTEFNTSPKQDIQDIYLTRKTFIDTEEVDLLASFLQSISDTYEEPIDNIEYLIKQSVDYMRKRSLEVMRDSLDECISGNDIARGENIISEYNNVASVSIELVDSISSHNDIIAAYTSEEEFLFKFPGALGMVCGDFKRTDFTAFAAFSKMGKCVVGSTKLLLSDGSYKSMSDIFAQKHKDIVCLDMSASKNTTGRITDYHCNGEKPVYKVTTRTGRSVVVTGNHPLLAWESKWKSIEEGLVVGDRIGVPRELSYFGTEKIPEHHIKLMGYLLADGCLVGTSVQYTKSDPILIQDVRECTEQMGNILVKYKNDYGYGLTGRSGHKNETRAMLDSYGIGYEGSKDKKVPNIIYTLVKEQVALFLRIMFSSDGSCMKNSIEYSSASEELLDGISHLLLRFGIVGTKRIKYAKGSPYYIYTIHSRAMLESYMEQIGFVGAKASVPFFSMKRAPRDYIDTFPNSIVKYLFGEFEKRGIKRDYTTVSLYGNGNLSRARTKEANSYISDSFITKLVDSSVMWDTVASIEYQGVQPTYDITVEDHHNFVGNDVYLHNSHALQYTADAALRHGYNVLFITLEMPIKQVLRRFWTSYSCQPKYTKDVRIPFFYTDDLIEEGKYRIDYEEKRIEGFAPTMESLVEWQKNFKKYFRRGSVKIASFPTRSATVRDLQMYVDNLEYYKGWKPDVIVVDYADLLASKQKDPRAALDDIWSTLRGWAMAKNILITTATQTGRASANSDSKIETISEDIRKISHVTSMIAINGSKEERGGGIYRWEQLVAREENVCVDQAVVLACLDIGKYMLDSRLKKDVVFEKSTGGGHND